MNKIKQFLSRYSSENFNFRYPEFEPGDGKIHVLYVSAHTSAVGFYRAILPALHLNDTDTHCAIVSQVNEFDMQKGRPIDSTHLNLSPSLVKWAHYIVFPTITSDLAPLIKDLRTINPDAQFVMDVDDNLFEMTPNHPAYNSYTNDMKRALINNMTLCDVVTGTNARLLRYYSDTLNDFMGNSTADNTCDFFQLPNLMSEYCYEDCVEVIPSPEKKRLLLSANPTQFADINPMRKVLYELQRMRNDYELVVFGWAGTHHKHMNNCLKDLKKTYISSVPFVDYFKKLHELAPVCGVMPLQDNLFNLGKSHHKLLQYCRQNILPVVSDIETYTDVTTSENPEDVLHISIAETNSQWLKLLNDALDADTMVLRARNVVTIKERYSYSTNIKLWQDCFCKI